MATEIAGPDIDVEPCGRGSGAGQRRAAVVAVALVLVFCASLRAFAADAHLPWQHHWDENTNVRVGQEMSDELAIDPGFYDYPALVFVTQAMVLVPAKVAGYDPAEDGDIFDVQSPGVAYTNHTGLLRAMRWTTGVLPQLVTTLVAALIAWVTMRRWYAAAGAAVLVALSAVDMRYGIYVTPDALSGMAATLASLGAVLVTRDPTRRRYLWTGAAIGLASAAKYNAATVAVVLVVAHVLTHRRPVADRRPLIEAAGAAVTVFAVVNMGGVLNPVGLVREIGSEGFHYSTGHFGSEGNSPVFHAEWLWRSFGLALPLAASSLLTRSTAVRRAAIVLLSFIATYYVFLSLFPVRFARNLLPISGTIAAAAAVGGVVCAERLMEATGRRVLTSISLVAILVAVLAVPITGMSRSVDEFGEDPWSDTRAWIHDNIPEGSKIAIEAWTPYIDTDRYELVTTNSLGRNGATLEKYTQLGVDYFVTSEEMSQPFIDHPDESPTATRLYEQVFDEDCMLYEVDGAGHRFRVTQAPPC